MLATRPQRGVLAGFLALIAFASGAVAITVRGAGASGTAATATLGTVTGGADADRADHGDGRDGARGVRFTERDGHGR